MTTFSPDFLSRLPFVVGFNTPAAEGEVVFVPAHDALTDYADEGYPGMVHYPDAFAVKFKGQLRELPADFKP